MTLTHHWSTLSNLQLGRYSEYLVKIELTLHGMDVYTAEVDDKGIDFIVRLDHLHYLDIQVKSSRNFTYVFMPKSKFIITENLFLALVLFKDDKYPKLYLIPSTVWLNPDRFFVDRNYEGLESRPEFGINLSLKNMPLLDGYIFDTTIENIRTHP